MKYNLLTTMFLSANATVVLFGPTVYWFGWGGGCL